MMFQAQDLSSFIVIQKPAAAREYWEYQKQQNVHQHQPACG